MAEFLIYAKNNAHADPLIDAGCCYKRGDIVVVKPDGWGWGREETLPTFFVLKIPGVDAAKAEKYIQHQSISTGVLDSTGAPVARMNLRRLFAVDLNNLPAGVRTQILSTGSVTATWNQVRSFLVNKSNQTNEGTVDVSTVS